MAPGAQIDNLRGTTTMLKTLPVEWDA